MTTCLKISWLFFFYNDKKQQEAVRKKSTYFFFIGRKGQWGGCQWFADISKRRCLFFWRLPWFEIKVFSIIPSYPLLQNVIIVFVNHRLTCSAVNKINIICLELYFIKSVILSVETVRIPVQQAVQNSTTMLDVDLTLYRVHRTSIIVIVVYCTLQRIL